MILTKNWDDRFATTRNPIPRARRSTSTLAEETIETRKNRRRADRVIWAGLGRLPGPHEAPTIVIEFVSEGKVNQERDYVVKRAEYREIGVKEYWIIDRFAKTMTVHIFGGERDEELMIPASQDLRDSQASGLRVASSPTARPGRPVGEEAKLNEPSEKPVLHPPSFVAADTRARSWQVTTLTSVPSVVALFIGPKVSEPLHAGRSGGRGGRPWAGGGPEVPPRGAARRQERARPRGHAHRGRGHRGREPRLRGAIEPIETRRNVVTRGVALNHLVGKRFRVGEVMLQGIRLCEPCEHLESLTRPGVRAALVHRGGLRAQILEGGAIRVGDSISRSEQ